MIANTIYYGILLKYWISYQWMNYYTGKHGKKWLLSIATDYILFRKVTSYVTYGYFKSNIADIT